MNLLACVRTPALFHFSVMWKMHQSTTEHTFSDEDEQHRGGKARLMRAFDNNLENRRQVGSRVTERLLHRDICPRGNHARGSGARPLLGLIRGS